MPSMPLIAHILFSGIAEAPLKGLLSGRGNPLNRPSNRIRKPFEELLSRIQNPLKRPSSRIGNHLKRPSIKIENL